MSSSVAGSGMTKSSGAAKRDRTSRSCSQRYFCEGKTWVPRCRSKPSAYTNWNGSIGSGALRLQRGHDGDVVNVLGGAASRKIIGRLRQTLQKRADRHGASQTLDQFVSDISCGESGEYERVGPARNLRPGR